MFRTRRRRSRSRRRNPSRRRASSRRMRRRNPARTRVRSHSRRRVSARRRHNPVRRRRNPSFTGALRQGLNRQFITNALLTSGGLILGTKTASLIARLPMADRLGRFSGALNLVLGGVLAGLVKNAHAKALFAGFAAGGAYNLVAANVPQLSLSTISGDDFLGVEVGDQPLVRLSGVEVGDQPLVMMGERATASWDNDY